MHRLIAHGLLLATLQVGSAAQHPDTTTAPLPPSGVTSPAPSSSELVLLNQYVETLERTNAQLSLWWTPLNTLISALGVLFAVGAIVGGFILYRQSRDYRKLLDDFIAASKERLDLLMNEKSGEMAALVDQASTLKQSLEALHPPKDEREKFEREIEEMNRAIKAMQAEHSMRIQLQTGKRPPSLLAKALDELVVGLKKCKQCGKPRVAYFVSGPWVCPYCKTENE